MDLRDTAEEAAFRTELRSWIEENLPEDLQGHRGGAARFEGPEMRAWSRALHDAGYAGLTWPTEYGGTRSLVHAPGDLPRGDGARRGAAARRRDRPRHGGADDHGPRHRGAEGALPGADPLRGGDLVPGILGAGRRLGSRGRTYERAPGERPLRRGRPEGLVVVRAPRELLHPRSLGATRSQPATPASPT